MKNIINKIIILILVICLCGCSSVSKIIGNNSYNQLNNLETAKASDYIDILRNYHVRNKNINNTEVDTAFDEFLHEVVVDTYEDSYTSLHYDFIDYKSFGIEKPEVTWGEVDEDKEPYIEESIDQLNKLHSFNYDKLSYRQQYDYEALEYSLYETLASLTCEFDISLLFDTKTNLLGNISSYLSDFIFYDKESLDDYMVLLADTDRYIEDAIEYTNKVANEHNYYLVDASIDETESYIDSFVEANPNALVSSFNERIDKLDFINSNEKNKYKEENKKIVKQEIIPSFKKVKEIVESQRGMTTTEENRLINLDEDFAEISFIISTSSNKTMDELFNNSASVLVDIINEIISIYYEEETISKDLERIENGEVEPLNDNYANMIEFLQENYTKTNPDLGVINYELSSIDASSASDSVLAYYWQSPIDKPEQNVIKYNPNSANNSESYESYFVLAHESIPGHMYDSYRSLLNNTNPIRRVLSFIGVSEGYAMYAEICAAKYLDINEKTQRYLVLNYVYGYIYDALLDLAINYYDYSDDDLTELMTSLGMSASDIDYLKGFFADQYCSLTSYGVGLANILYLKNMAEQSLGDKFDEVEFNDILTRNGILPFVVIEDEVKNYIEYKK